MKFNVGIAFPSGLIASGSLIFNGTLITLNAVYQPPPFDFVVRIDSFTSKLSHTVFESFLYQSDPLDPNKEHTITVNPISVVESVTVEMDLGNRADTMFSLDNGQLFEDDGFVATGSWNTDACLSARRAGTCYVSGGSGSSISYTFEGDAITLSGVTESSNSPYQVSMDGAQSVLYTPSNRTGFRVGPFPTVALAHYSNLGPGYHTLKLTSLPIDGKSRIEIDSAQVYFNASMVGGSRGPTTVGPSTASSTALPADVQSSGHLSKSATIAIIIGTLLGVLALVGLFFIYKLRRKNAKLAAARRHDAAVAAAGVREEFSLRRSRDFDEATLASSRFSVKEGLELSVVESQTEARKSEEAAKGGFTWRS